MIGPLDLSIATALPSRAGVSVVVGAALALILPACAGHAQSAASPNTERCEGTLCDLYYGSRPAAGAPPAAAATGTASTAAAPSSGGLMNWFGRGEGPKNAQPVEPPSATNGYMALGAGGVLGGRQERCSGTLCDTYYGVVSDDKTGDKQANAATPASEPPVPHRHLVHESETRPKCSSPTADPWRCYR